MASKSRMHSLLTTLPAVMLVLGLGYYYLGERAQTHSAPLLDQLQSYEGVFLGKTTVGGSQWGKHYLWLGVSASDDTVRRVGFRILQQESAAFEAARRAEKPLLNVDDPIRVEAAPTVSDSGVRWVVRLWRGSELVFDREKMLAGSGAF